MVTVAIQGKIGPSFQGNTSMTADPEKMNEICSEKFLRGLTSLFGQLQI